MTKSRFSHRRKRIRLQGYDYSSPGGYFITQGVQYRRPILAHLESGRIVLTDFGEMVRDAWFSMENRFFGFVKLDAFVIMPDHIHGIIFITDTVTSSSVPAALVAAKPKRPALGDIIGAFKSITTITFIRGVHDLGWTPFSKRLWERMYYEHIIRNDSDLQRIRRYIEENPFHPDVLLT